MDKIYDRSRLKNAIAHSAFAQSWPQSEAWGALLIRFEKDEMLCRAGEAIEYMLLILRGRAKVYNLTEDGRCRLHAVYRDCGVVGDLELAMDRRAANSCVQALTPVEAIAIPMQDCRAALEKDAALARLIMRQLAEKLAGTTALSARAAGGHTLGERLVGYIRDTHQEDGLGENLTQLSELLGVSYRHMLRTVSALRAQGILVGTPRGYALCERFKPGQIEKNAGAAVKRPRRALRMEEDLG